MDSGLKSLSRFSATNSPSSLMMARNPFPQPPLLPLPLPEHLQASPPPQRPSWPAPARSPRKKAASAPILAAASAPILAAASAPILAAAPPYASSAEYSMYSVSPPPSSVPMPTSLLLAASAGRKKAPTPCAVEVASVGGVDVGATDELRRLLRL